MRMGTGRDGIRCCVLSRYLLLVVMCMSVGVCEEGYERSKVILFVLLLSTFVSVRYRTLSTLHLRS